MGTPGRSPGPAARGAFTTGSIVAVIAWFVAFLALYWSGVISLYALGFAMLIGFPVYLILVASALSVWLGYDKDPSNLRPVTRERAPDRTAPRPVRESPTARSLGAVGFSSPPAEGSLMDEPTGGTADHDPVVSCEFQGGTLSVYEDRVTFERSKRSMFDDTTVSMDEIEDVAYTGGIMTGHIQIHRTGVEPASGGLLSHPVDEYTLHFPRIDRPCAERARDAILSRASEE
jgi:hypothetical protein